MKLNKWFLFLVIVPAIIPAILAAPTDDDETELEDDPDFPAVTANNNARSNEPFAEAAEGAANIARGTVQTIGNVIKV